MRRIIVLVAATLAFSTARANECSKEDRERAKVHFSNGAKAFRLNDLPKATEAFKAAYSACEAPLFLYNLGQAYRQLKDNENALYFYKQFLATTTPTDERRKDVEKWIRQLEEQIDNQRRIQEAPPPGPATPIKAPESEPTTVSARHPSESAVDPATAARSSSLVSINATAPSTKTPIYKRAWFWGVLAGVVAVGVGVGVGVGLGTASSTSKQVPGVTF